MAHLTELQVENVKSHMMREEDALRIKFKAKNTEFDTISRPHNEVEDYEKKGYSVGSGTDVLSAFGLSSNTVEWSLSAVKDNEGVSITKYRNGDDAKEAYESYKKNLKDGYAVKKVGKIVIYGTKQGVRDAG